MAKKQSRLKPKGNPKKPHPQTRREMRGKSGSSLRKIAAAQALRAKELSKSATALNKQARSTGSRARGESAAETRRQANSATQTAKAAREETAARKRRSARSRGGVRGKGRGPKGPKS